MTAPPDFAAQIAALETKIKEAEAAGDTIPPEAYQMLNKLRELTAALASLTASFDAPSDDPERDR